MVRLRLAFFGSADFSTPTLVALLDAGHEIAAVYTRPPRPAGRGHRVRPSPVHALAEARGLTVMTPSTLRAPGAQQEFAALAVDAGVVAAYGLILPSPILREPRLGFLNVHASLLPRWRGAAPIERAILAGDAETGVTIMQVDEGLDTGPILLAERVPITASARAETLHDELAVLGARLMVEALDRLADGRLPAVPQPAEGATYAAKLDRDEGRIDWTRPAGDLERVVRALNPRPGVWFRHDDERIRVLAARVASGAGRPGTVIDDRLAVACGTGALRLTRLQREGRAALDADAFLRGCPLPAGTVLA
jgi:methionyl-tRNA formyltransferase